MQKHEEYYDELERRFQYFRTDLEEELENIERLIAGNESAVLLLQWVRDAISRVAENYER